MSEILFPPPPSPRTRRKLRAARIFFFIAYARDDAARIQPILDGAREEGHLLWIDHVDLRPGEMWSGDIVAAIRAARAVIVFCSERAFASRDVYREVATASRFNKPIVPVFIEEARAPDEFMYYLSVHQAVRVGEPDWRAHFLCALEAMETGRRRWSAENPRNCPPSVG